MGCRKLQHLFISSKTATLVPEFVMEEHTDDDDDDDVIYIKFSLPGTSFFILVPPE